MAFPEAVAQDDDVRGSQPPLAERASDLRLDTDDIEEVRADDFPPRDHDFITGAERKISIGERCQRFEAAILLLPVEERRIGDTVEPQRPPRFGRKDHGKIMRSGYLS